MVTAHRELPPGTFPSEIGVQFLFSRRMYGYEKGKALVADIIFDLEPNFVGVRATDDGRGIYTTFVWDRYAQDKEAEARLIESIAQRLLPVVQCHYPATERVSLEALELGVEFRNPTLLRE